MDERQALSKTKPTNSQRSKKIIIIIIKNEGNTAMINKGNFVHYVPTPISIPDQLGQI